MAFIDRGQVGAKRALGMGEFGCLSVHVRRGEHVCRIMQVVDGQPVWTPDDYLTVCLDEAEKALDALDPENLEAVIR